MFRKPRNRLIPKLRELLNASMYGLCVAFSTASAFSQTLYSIGNPTVEEQLFVELINRAREDADAEALRLANTDDEWILLAISQFGVDLDLMIQQFATLPQSLPPLAINTFLQDAAYTHALDQFENQFQGHVGTDGSSLSDRATTAGYQWGAVAENTFAYSRSVEFGHAGFQIDWGGSAETGGMQDPPGHRENIHDAIDSGYREIGVGVVLGENGAVGPMVVVQKFGRVRFNDMPFLTGVAFVDADSDGFYDPGEGLGGVEIRVEGNDFYAVTASSGGYAIPLTANSDGAYSVIIEGSDFTSETVIIVQNRENVKLDIIPQKLSSVPEEVSEFVASLFPNAVAVSEGWAFDASFGLFFTDSEPWLFHQRLGWLYAQTDSSSGGAYLYDEERGWLWMTLSDFPYLYDVETSVWYSYSVTGDGTAWLYDFEAASWMLWDATNSEQ